MSTADASQYQTQHCFVEVGGDLLSKPSSLSDLLEQHGFPTTLVFCNTPSDTDLLEVLLKKRGISATKLIGYVPPQKLEQTLAKIRSREISTVVVTDIAARNLNLGEFELVLNYSIQNDGELYLQRAGLSSGNTSEPAAGSEERPVRTPARKIVSLVGPLDIANFHFLKKAANVEFTKLEPPSKEQVLAARVDNLAKRASQSPATADEGYRSMAAQVLKHGQKDSIVAMLLQSALEIVPQLSADIEKLISERDAFSMDDELQPGSLRHGGQGQDEGRGYGGGNQRGGGRGRGGRDRDRGGRRGDFDNRGNRGGYQSRGEGQRFDDEGDNFRGQDDQGNTGGNQGGDEDFNQGDFREGDRGGRRQGRGNRDGGRRNDRDGYRGREDRAPRNIIRIKDDRLYIGQGARDGFSEEAFASLLTDQCGVTREQLKRFSLRERYSFADLPEEVSAKVLESLKEREVGGKKLFITKAVTLTTTHEGPADSTLEGEPGFGGDSHGGQEGEHHDGGSNDEMSGEANAAGDSYQQ